ncbi:TetR/AcrR family transcriptional regulator [Actinoplanes sp. Pm04-4]|uniref:TetR/AcrR family transcriptional regulator n=1 Tax=Paractinoplanes pyxinae TaxID=2997416 RepID=A0ABT4B0Y7_9ACTN|nr:TetR/AcrR family transcriptional regulator [Actinoplanes pyxinae]MCY1140168.1 TetR/AcrR family transcriptional regulator [Actinoplanes pyxinae]
MPTGVALRDVRQQLFDAAQRVLLRNGPNALTSRAVTTEAGCAKGVLHRHFTDFDDFLAELVRRRIAGFQAWGATMVEAAGSGQVDENIADLFSGIFDPVGLALISLLLSRDDLRARVRTKSPRTEAPRREAPRSEDLRSEGPRSEGSQGESPQGESPRSESPRVEGPPFLVEATAVVAAYLNAEQARQRVPADADVRTLALALVGAAHLVFADREGDRPGPAATRQLIASILTGANGRPQQSRAGA